MIQHSIIFKFTPNVFSINQWHCLESVQTVGLQFYTSDNDHYIKWLCSTLFVEAEWKIIKASPHFTPSFFNQFWCPCTVHPPGYLVGYISHRKPRVEPGNCDTQLDTENQVNGTPADFAPPPQFQLDWKDITQLLTQKLTSQNFEKTLR